MTKTLDILNSWWNILSIRHKRFVVNKRTLSRPDSIFNISYDADEIIIYGMYYQNLPNRNIPIQEKLSGSGTFMVRGSVHTIGYLTSLSTKGCRRLLVTYTPRLGAQPLTIIDYTA